MLAVRVLFFLTPQVSDQNFQFRFCVFHQYHCMLLFWFDYLEDLARFTSVAALQNTHTLSYFEELDELLGSNLDLDRNLIKCLEC